MITKNKTLKFAILASCLFTNTLLAQEIDSLLIKKQEALVSNEEENRNVMLNASNNTSPRDVNIGLPSSVGGITILENDLPVVYLFWPELPNRTWRQSLGLESTGLLKMEQVANTIGDLGFAVNSYSQTGTKDFKVQGKFTTNNFGWLQPNVNVSGPISKTGWAYTADAFLNYDPSTYKMGFARNTDATKIFRLGLTKFFNNAKGKITATYKYADSYNISNYALFEYGENGKVTELENFRIGRDSYVVNDGKTKLKNILTGQDFWASLTGKDNKSTSHNLDIFGNYELANDWNFKFSTRFHSAEVNGLTLIPISIFQVDDSSGYTYASTGQVYTGPVGTQLAMNTGKTPIKSIAGRFSLNKQFENHNLTIGLLEQYYHVDKFTSNRSFFFQTAEPQPSRLIGPGTDKDGFYNYNVGGEFHSGTENKLSLYGTDNWKVSESFNLTYGLLLRYHLVDGQFSMTPRTDGFYFQPDDFTKINENWFHTAGHVNATYNLSKNFGVLANFLYTEENRRLESYSQPYAPDLDKIKSPLGALGIFWNTDWIQLVSQASYLKRNGYLGRYNLVNPDNSTDAQTTSVNYGIKTFGWTTDILLQPFKGFNFHYLLTLQSPKNDNFNFDAFGKSYDYNNKIVVGVSKVLMEIDPSYSIDKWKIWASFRYFGKQYANLTNVLYFAPRMETFGGVNYSLNKNINIEATVINFLNQRGASGTINGAELITDATPYYGQLLTGNYIMPLTGQLTVNFKF